MNNSCGYLIRRKYSAGSPELFAETSQDLEFRILCLLSGMVVGGSAAQEGGCVSVHMEGVVTDRTAAGLGHCGLQGWGELHSNGQGVRRKPSDGWGGLTIQEGDTDTQSRVPPQLSLQVFQTMRY